MSTSTEKTKQTVLDSLITELLNSGSGKTPVEICLSGNQKAISSVPVRSRIIALGFVKKLSLDEVNRKLTENGCDKLYARSLLEATLIYAFRNGCSYEEWKVILREASALKEEICSDSFFSKGTVTLNALRRYVMNNSVVRNELAMTMHKTQLLQRNLIDSPMEKVQLKEFLLSNINSFCTFREKSRYYFAKYLMYYLISIKGKYLQSIERKQLTDEALENLAVFKSITVLKRKKHSIGEADAILWEAGVSFKEIYQSFQDFYFEYTSTDWMGVLLQRYGDFDQLTEKQKSAVAAYIRKYNATKASLSDQDILTWQKGEIERKEKAMDQERSYQANRAGENFLRKILRGELDMDRTTLMAFLLFFDWNAAIPEEHRIDKKRLDDILSECGFSKLDPGSFVDEFFMDYMTAEDPIDFLIGEAEIMAMSEENFYLYKTYLNSKSNESEWGKIT